jgi:two-component system, OmpR family, response regulator
MERSPHIIVVDDDREICSLLSQFLTRHGLRVTTARDGAEMTKFLETARVDLVVLDLMLPGDDGLALCRRIRSSCGTPVIMLTAMGEDVDRIIGLEMGADDYLPKPFNPRELLARIKAVLRRSGALAQSSAELAASGRVLSFENWRLDLAKRELMNADDELIALSSGEFDLLQAFAEHPRRVLTRDQLLDLARGRAATLFDRSVDIQVMRLRRKIELDPKDPQLIKTVRSGGYMFTPTVHVSGVE